MIAQAPTLDARAERRFVGRGCTHGRASVALNALRLWPRETPVRFTRFGPQVFVRRRFDAEPHMNFAGCGAWQLARELNSN